MSNPKAPFVGVIAHHPGPCPVQGHGDAFHHATVELGLPATEYFRFSGIRSCAKQAGGLCSFWMGGRLALYQINNRPLLDDEYLAASTEANHELFGGFLGSLHISDPRRAHKRRVVEQALGSQRFIDGLKPEIFRLAGAYLRPLQNLPLCMEQLAMQWVSHVDSHLPGVLDCRVKTLAQYLEDDRFKSVVSGFFEQASKVISHDDAQGLEQQPALMPFVKDLLLSNFESIGVAPSSNLILGHFALWGLAFTRQAIAQLSQDQALEIGTIIIATYDTTALSLLWSMAYIETSPRVKREIILAATNDSDHAPHVIDLAVMEALRLGGSNPTALWRRTIKACEIEHGGQRLVIPADTLLWLDRWQANRDPQVFPRPEVFDPGNILVLQKSGDQPHAFCTSLLARNRYDINSFSMLNTRRNPRKCPGRLFSVQMQGLLLRELYGHYEVSSTGIDLSLRRYCAMPKPARSGVMTLRLKKGGHADDQHP